MSTALLPRVATHCVIPAAGRSSRMGAWKPMMPWGSTTVCGTVVDAVLAAGLIPLVVAGYRAEELTAWFSARPEVVVVQNPAWERGMLGSIRVGVEAAMGPLADSGGFPAGVFVALADMPRVPVRSFAALARVASAQDPTHNRVVFASRDGQLGHPVWIPRAFFAGLASLDPDARLRNHLLELPWVSAEVDDDGIFVDIDTPDAYEAQSLRG